MKKLFCLLLALSLALGCMGISAAAAGKDFTDVAPGQWFQPYISAVASQKLVEGFDDGSFRPGEELTWAQTVVFAVRLDQWSRGEKPYGVEDQTGPWYSVYTDYAMEHGFISGLPDSVSAPISRGGAADIFARVLGESFEVVNELPDDYFRDVPAGSGFHGAVMALAKAGIVNGVETGRFGVDQGFKRSEVAAIVARLASLAEKVVIPVAPAHSEYYIEGLSVDDLIMYFNEVCLDTEMGDKTYACFVQKWMSPIRYLVYGSPTQEDIRVLEATMAQLNTIEGMPEIAQADGEWDANLRISFCDARTLIDTLGSGFTENEWGGVSFWYYLPGMDIYDEKICVRSDIDQLSRSSIIVEEIYNGLGPVQDTALRWDSIIYQWSNSNLSMSDIDVLILKMLYHPDMLPGYDADQCAGVIRSLYW